MIAEITLCALCIGSFAMYIAFVAGKIAPDSDPVLFQRRLEPIPETVFYSCCDPWGKHK
jgi:hypothetical protein